jgi:hypothetical protein
MEPRRPEEKERGIRGARMRTTVVVRRKNAAEQRKNKEE